MGLWIAIVAATLLTILVTWMVFNYVKMQTSQFSTAAAGTSVAATTQFTKPVLPNFAVANVTGKFYIVRQSMPLLGRPNVVRCWSGSSPGKLRSGLNLGSTDVLVDTSGPGTEWTIQTAGPNNAVYITQGDVLTNMMYLSYYVQSDNDRVFMSKGASETTDIVWTVEQDPSNVLYARFSAMKRDPSVSSTYLKWNEQCDSPVSLVPVTIPNASQLEWRLDQIVTTSAYASTPMYASAAPAAASSASRLFNAVSAAIVSPWTWTKAVNAPPPVGSV